MSEKLEFVQQVFSSREQSSPEVSDFHVDIDAVRVCFKNGEEVIVTQSFYDREKYDLWLSARDPFKANQILTCLEKQQAADWLEAINYRILRAPSIDSLDPP